MDVVDVTNIILVDYYFDEYLLLCIKYNISVIVEFNKFIWLKLLIKEENRHFH